MVQLGLNSKIFMANLAQKKMPGVSWEALERQPQGSCSLGVEHDGFFMGKRKGGKSGGKWVDVSNRYLRTK